jgi:hypothetical protein
LLALPPAANAQILRTLLSFDDLPAGTVLTSQYHNYGLDLSGLQFINNTLVVTSFAGAPSSPNVLDIGYGANEFPRAGLRGVFTDPHHQYVKMRISTRSIPDGVSAALYIYDSGGNIITSTTGGTASGTFGTLLASAPNSNIASFAVTVGTSFAVIDDISFDPIFGDPLPDFSIFVTSVPVKLLPGGPSVVTNIAIGRLNGSTDNISLSLSNLPAGVTGVINPNPTNGPDGATVAITLTASAAANPGAGLSFTVTGNPTPNAGAFGSHSANIPLEILDSYDAQVLGIEVTQGIQTYSLPSGAVGALPLTGASVNYAGVKLAAGGKTIVRVFADYVRGPKNTADPVLSCVLYGTANGQPLPGSPLQDSGLGGGFRYDLFGGNYVDDDTRAGGASIFVLPDAWTSGTINLTAQLQVVHQFGGDPSSDNNAANDTFTLTNIAFTPTRAVQVLEVPLTFDGSFPYGPKAVFEETRNLLPIGSSQFYASVSGYRIDISDIFHKGGLSVSERTSLAADRLKDMAEDFNLAQSGTYVVGVYSESADPNNTLGGITTASGFSFLGIGDTGANVAIVQDQKRPLTAVAHEFGHLLGREHASYANGGGANGQNAESWPPDELGFIQGVGFDRRTLTVKFPGDPYHGNRIAPYIYDFMSYQANNNNDPDSWISVKGWDEEIRGFATGPAGSAVARVKTFAQSQLLATAAAAPVPGLRIRAYISLDGVVHVTKVGALNVAPHTPPASSTYSLRVHDNKGRVHPEIPMDVSTAHADQSTNLTMLSALCQQIAPETIKDIEITRNGVVVARQARSPHAPSVRILKIQPDTALGEDVDDQFTAAARAANPGNVTKLRWIATDLDHDALLTTVDYSSDGGKTWSPLFTGPNQNQVVLPAAIFPKNSHALIRLRVNDGFNETLVVSKPFVAAGAPPDVEITNPADGNSGKSGGAFYFSGTALNDARQPLPGSSLTWRIGTTVLGTGNSISVSDLPVGPNVITLTATDAKGRSSVASVTINVLP